MQPSGQVNVGKIARRIPLVILAYMLWLASAALSLWAVFWLRIVVLIDLPIMVLRLNRWTLVAVDKFGTVILGLVWLLFVLASEADFRKLLERPRPAAFVAKVFAVEVLVLGTAYGGHLLIA
jgi:hypothetical protein